MKHSQASYPDGRQTRDGFTLRLVRQIRLNRINGVKKLADHPKKDLRPTSSPGKPGTTNELMVWEKILKLNSWTQVGPGTIALPWDRKKRSCSLLRPTTLVSLERRAPHRRLRQSRYMWVKPQHLWWNASLIMLGVRRNVIP